MQFKNTIVSQLLAVGLATALPQATPTSTPEAGATPSAFSILSLRSASDIHFSSFQASIGNIFLQLPDQGASCDAESDNTATFYLKDGGLYLYSTSNPPQQLYADRSGMGQGKLGYITGAQNPPRNGELTGWTIDASGDLTLDGASFLACPNSIDGAWAVWVSAGVAQPAGNEGCLGLVARVVEVTEPNACLYTE
ncbi:hypothetical protein AK830_g7187 [Neonectria ditissima]|uniref:Cell wall protein PhiA n=1 Tax=Neonectria ditissima TaxID=78410 RepID=A0A0P7AXQ7_9HYPO|nr:hypothetical protein AK830_g7187 [Neonectria ditissima]